MLRCTTRMARLRETRERHEAARREDVPLFGRRGTSPAGGVNASPWRPSRRMTAHGWRGLAAVDGARSCQVGTPPVGSRIGAVLRRL